MDPQSNFKALPGKSMCALLKGTDLRCLNEEDCDLLKKAGIDCPYTFGASNGTSGNKGQSRGDSSSSSAMPAVYVVASVCVIVIVVFSLYFLKRRRRNRKVCKKFLEQVNFHSMFASGISICSSASINETGHKEDETSANLEKDVGRQAHSVLGF